MVVGAEKHAARVSQARGCRWQLRALGIKLGPLNGIHGVGRLIRAGEVTHDQRQFKPVEKLRLCGECIDLGGRKAEPVDPRVDVHGSAQPLPGGPAVGGPFADLRQAAEAGPRIEPAIERRRAGQQPVEHIDRGAGKNIANASSLRQGCHEERVAALRAQRARDLFEAEAVCVRLDDAGALRTSRCRVELVPVVAQGSKVDREHRTRPGGYGSWSAGPDRGCGASRQPIRSGRY